MAATTTTTTATRTPAEPLHNDVYECLCSPGAGSAGGGSEEEGDGVMGGGGFFAPRNFKRRLADTLMERMRSRADTTSAMMAMEVDGQQEPRPASGESKKRTFGPRGARP